MKKPVKVIDLFAGPGGLGEGFSSLRIKGSSAFKIAISIEMEESAHRTLLLRSLFRQFGTSEVPDAYYEFLQGKLGSQPEDILYNLPEIQEALSDARREAQRLTLGEASQKTIYGRIRDVIGEDECILIGGPPCQAYSLAGRSRNYGDKTRKYIASEDHRNYLYREYLKIISKFQPMIFVMENVKGMLSAKIDGEPIFDAILDDLGDPFKTIGVTPDGKRKKHRYKIFSLVKDSSDQDLFGDQHLMDPHDFVIRTEEYGIPQARHRVILLGIREDIIDMNDEVSRLVRTDNVVSVRDVISDLPKIRSKLSKSTDSAVNWRDSIAELNGHILDRLYRDKSIPDNVYNSLADHIDTLDRSPETTGANVGIQKKSEGYSNHMPNLLAEWYKDPRLVKYVINHESRGHITSDLHRYLYYSVFSKVTGKSPNSSNLPKALWPAHKNFGSGKFADRFRVQLSSAPGTTVTSHISKDGHYFIHYDPYQCRSLTVREAARIQTFPDNYFFVGNRTQQYVQVGNAVPPMLAYKIASIAFSIIN